MRGKRPGNFEQVTERIREKIDAPVLSPGQARILDSGYINSPDKALELLEKADQYKEAVFNGKLPPGEKEIIRN